MTDSSFQEQLKLFAKLADSATDLDLFEILNAMSRADEAGCFRKERALFFAVRRTVINEIRTRECLARVV